MRLDRPSHVNVITSVAREKRNSAGNRQLNLTGGFPHAARKSSRRGGASEELELRSVATRSGETAPAHSSPTFPAATRLLCHRRSPARPAGHLRLSTYEHENFGNAVYDVVGRNSHQHNSGYIYNRHRRRTSNQFLVSHLSPVRHLFSGREEPACSHEAGAWFLRKIGNDLSTESVSQ